MPIQLNSDGKRILKPGGSLLLTTDTTCCCCAKHCYQRWTAGWDCYDQVSTGAPVAHEFTCYTTAEAASKITWHRTGTTGSVCTYEIYVKAACCDTTTCDGLPDTAAPTGPDASDCIPLCDCCVPPNTVITVSVDSTAMIPEVPIDNADGTWHTILPVAPGDWHLYLGSPEWIAHPQTIFVGGGSFAYPVDPFIGSGIAAYYDCSVTPDTQPTGQGGVGSPFPTWGTFGSYGCGWEIGTFNYSVSLTCNGIGHTDYTVGVIGWSNDDLFTGLPGFYQYFGSNGAAILDCVDGRPVGTVVVDMQWSTGDINFGPGSPYDCGSITCTFS